MKTFEDLIKEVQDSKRCHHCGGCVTFCTSVNYGALEVGPEGMPRYKDQDQCIECGLCYSICPEIDELQEETKQVSGWQPPFGNVIETTIARSVDPQIRQRATDGGVVTALLVHLMDRGHIDGAIVTHQTGPFRREPFLATTRQQIIESAGFYMDTSRGFESFGATYCTYSPSVQEFKPMIQKGLRRVAMVGTPCQIKTLRKIQALEIVPSDSIRYCLGLFCSGNFFFGDEQRKRLEEIGEFSWMDVKKVNIKESLKIHLNTGEMKTIPLDQLDFMKRHACQFCADYAAEYSDVSFGGIGAEKGWTSVIVRTPVGRAIFADAKKKAVEIYPAHAGSIYSQPLIKEIHSASQKKKALADEKRSILLLKDSFV